MIFESDHRNTVVASGYFTITHGICKKKQQKWRRKFSPYLVIKELPPVNYVIQKTKRSRPFVAHVDKLKPWYSDDLPKSWLSDGDGCANTDADPGLVNTGSGTRPSDNALGMDAVGAPGVDVTVTGLRRFEQRRQRRTTRA